MTLRTKNIIFIGGLSLLFFMLWGISLFADVPQGYTGLGEMTALSPDDGTVVFSYYKDGDASLYEVPVTGGKAEQLVESEEGHSYIDPAFSPDGKKIAFINQWEEDEQPFGELMMYDFERGTIEQLTEEGNHITGAAFTPNGEDLYLLQSSVYENYSPIASEHPHGFDLFHLDIQTKEITQVTEKDAYHMSDIAVTPDGKQAMYHSYEDEDMLVFYSLEDGKETYLKPKGPDLKESIIYTPALSQSGRQIVFSGVAGQNGNFIYEGFLMDIDTREAKQVTSFQKHVTSPILFSHQDKLLVTVDKNFAGDEPAYGYWVVDIDESDRRQWIEIEMSEEDDAP